MLVEFFGMEWFNVHDEAERLEHAVSEDFLRKLIERLGALTAAFPSKWLFVTTYTLSQALRARRGDKNAEGLKRGGTPSPQGNSR